MRFGYRPTESILRCAQSDAALLQTGESLRDGVKDPRMREGATEVTHADHLHVGAKRLQARR